MRLTELVLVALGHPEIATFESALRGLGERVDAAEPNDAEGLFRDAFQELATSGLSDEESSRRARRLTEVFSGHPDISHRIVNAARQAEPAVRTGVLSALTPRLRAELFAEPEASAQTPIGSSPDLAVAPVAEEGQTDEPDAAVPGEWRTVLLLGEAQEVEQNERFLAESGYQAIRVATEDHLRTLRGESHCAVVAHAGFWSSLEATRTIKDVLSEQLQCESILLYKLDSSAFGEDGAEVVSLLDTLGSDVQSRVVLADGATLNETDLALIERYAALLESSSRATLRVERISEQESTLLTTAAALFVARLRGHAVPSRVRDLAVSPLTDGKSLARVLRLVVPASGYALVAKLDRIDRLQAEIQTARLVMPPTQRIEMEIYALGGASVLLQKLQAATDLPTQTAPSLKERLAARVAWERGSRHEPEPQAADLHQAVQRLVTTITSVAERSADGAIDRCWLGTEPLDALADNGGIWRINSSAGDFDPRTPLGGVAARLGLRNGTRLVHGDLHVGNVLLSDDRTPVLIDFANAGAGHPLFDLVRVSASVVYTHLRPFVPEPDLRDFFARAHLERATYESLCADFGSIIAQPSAKLAASSLCKTRDAGFVLLAGTEDAGQQYLAMTYLIAAQSLTMPEFQNASVRATLGAIFPALVHP